MLKGNWNVLLSTLVRRLRTVKRESGEFFTGSLDNILSEHHMTDIRPLHV